VLKQNHKKIRSKLKVKVFLKFFKSGENEEKSQKTLLKCRKLHFLENLILQTGNTGFQQGRKSNSTPNAYKIIMILITRAKIMVF